MAKAKRKTRKDKEAEYVAKYSNIPIDYKDRLDWMCDQYKLNESVMNMILEKRDNMLSQLYYTDILVILYEVPEGTPRPRFRLITPKNYASVAAMDKQYIHVYSPNASEDNKFMKRMVNDGELYELQSNIITPCSITFNAFYETPKSFSRVDKFMSEIGIFNPITKPDWDNIGKKYSDMYNSNVWIDDSIVTNGVVSKFYSILPRVEIHLKYLNAVFNKYQYDSITGRKDYDPSYNLQYFNSKGELMG